MAFLVNLHSPVEFRAGIARSRRVGSDGHGRTCHEVPYHPRLFDVLVEVLGISISPVKQGTVVADIESAIVDELVLLSGDPGFGGWCRLEGALDHRCALIVNVPHGLLLIFQYVLL